MNAMTDLSATPAAAPDVRPTAFELVTRTRLDDLVAQVSRVEAKLNALLVAAVGALLADLLR
jgi:hypothetical protein